MAKNKIQNICALHDMGWASCMEQPTEGEYKLILEMKESVMESCAFVNFHTKDIITLLNVIDRCVVPVWGVDVEN